MEAPVTWSDAALAFLRAHADKGLPFLAEEVAHAATEAKFIAPPEPRAWAGVLLRAAREGYIEKIGTRASKGVGGRKGHGNQRALWQRVGIRKPVSPLIQEAGKALGNLPPDMRHRVTEGLTKALSYAYAEAKRMGL